MELVIGNQAHVRLVCCHAAGKVLICCTLAHRNTYVTLSPHQLAPLSSSLPPFFLCDSGHHLNIWYCSRFPPLSLSLVFFSLCPFPFFLVVMTLWVLCLFRLCVCMQVYNPNPFCPIFLPSLCLFDYAIVSTLLLCTRLLPCACLRVCLHAWLGSLISVSLWRFVVNLLVCWRNDCTTVRW